MDETAPEMPRSVNWPRWLLVAVILAAIVGFYVSGLHERFGWNEVKANLDGWKAQANDHLLLALLIYFIVYVLVTGLSLPVAVPLSLLAGALFDRWLGTAVVSLASTTGATLAFLMSRYLLRDWVERRFGARLEPLQRGVEKDGAFYLFTLRLVPVVPFFLINLGMGLTPMRASRFALVSWLGMLLGTFLFVNAGTELERLESPAGILSWPILLSFAALGLTPLVLRKVVQWRAARQS